MSILYSIVGNTRHNSPVGEVSVGLMVEVQFPEVFLFATMFKSVLEPCIQSLSGVLI
jgi:hypothetical protein